MQRVECQGICLGELVPSPAQSFAEHVCPSVAQMLGVGSKYLDNQVARLEM